MFIASLRFAPPVCLFLFVFFSMLLWYGFSIIIWQTVKFYPTINLHFKQGFCSVYKAFNHFNSLSL